MEPNDFLQDENDYNKTAQYAAALRQAGGRLSLTPSTPKDEFGLDKPSESDDLVHFYESNPNKIIDLSKSDAKQHWEKLVQGMHKRHVNWGEQILTVGEEIAKLPFSFAEGLIEEKGNPITIGASAAEGVVRSVRDLWGMIGESENPTSALFWAKSTIRAIKTGKISQNWEEEAQQWNETRKFLWDSYKIQQGDMSVYERLPYVNMSESTAQKLRSLSNPKIAHALSFIGLELPSLLAAPFTGGATAGAAIAAGATAVGRTAAIAQKASTYAKIMGTLTETGKRLDALAAGAALRTTGAVATGLSKAISVPANLVENVVGSNIDALARRGGVESSAARNIVASQAINGMADIGAGEIRQTVGYLGSLGLRTTAELLGEVGEQATLLANGVVTADQINGLSVLERVANTKTLSPSAAKAAKAINVIVDPIVQMSTAALKHGYKDSLMFAGLGYMNDWDRGAIGGATMGMVWGGYSGAVRHMWANITGGVQHERFIKDFDERFLPQLDKFNPEFANLARKVIADVDLGKSTKISSNARFVFQQMHLSLDPMQKKQLIASASDYKSTLEMLDARGVVSPEIQLDRRGGGQFSLVVSKDGGLVPLLWLNPEKYRPADFGHEVLGHMLIWNLTTRNQIGTHLLEFFGMKKNGGLWSDKAMAERAALRRSLEEALQENVKHTIDSARARANEIYNGDADTVGSVRYFEKALEQMRSSASMADFHTQNEIKTPDGRVLGSDPAVYDTVTNKSGVQSPIKYIFEEFMAEHAENMFIHTNLQNLSMPKEDMPLRMYFERKYTERLARVATELEMAGVIAKYGAPLTEKGDPTVQAHIYDDGVYKRAPHMDTLLKNMVVSAQRANDGPVHQLSPEMQLAVAKKHRKEFLFNIRGNGATLKGEKERNEMSALSAKNAFDVIDALPDELKPKITIDEHGNRSADVYTMKDEVIDAFVESGILDPESGRVAKVFRDTYMQYESSGFATSNLVYAQNLGDSHRTAVGNLFRRIFGEDVPVTNRVFVPFELKVYFRTTDGSGKQLRAPRGGFTATVMDYTAVHRRQIKTWSRPDVKALWSSIGEFNKDFHHYLMNFLREPSARVDTVTLFKSKFGADAEKVRDIMYETFGASKRKDESYINPPRDGYFSSHENPNFPIHSLKLENLLGVERLVASPFPYHHGRSYEPLRRNLSVAGFEEISANVFANGQGYRVIRERSAETSKWKVFSPFGGLVGRYSEKEKAFKAAQKHLRKEMNPADVLSLVSDEEWSQMNRTDRLQRIQEDGRRFNEYHEAKLQVARNTNLSLAPVRKEGKSFVPTWVNDNELVRLFDGLMKGEMPFSFKELVSNLDDLEGYRASNGIGWNLGNIRIMPNQVNGYKVDSGLQGKSVKLMKHPKTGEIMVYVDTDYYKSMAFTDMRDFMLQDIQSELMHIAEASHEGSSSKSFMTLEASSLDDFGSHIVHGNLIKEGINAHLSGQHTADAPVIQYVEERSKAINSQTFKNLLESRSAKDLESAIKALDGDNSLPADFRKSIVESHAIYGINSGNYVEFLNLIRSASKMLVPDDMSKAKLVKYVDRSGVSTVGMLMTNDIRQHAKDFTKILADIPSDQTANSISLHMARAFAHWGPQVASKGDTPSESVNYLGRSGRSSGGGETQIVFPEFTAEGMGSDINESLFIIAEPRNSQILEPNGMISVITPEGRTAVKGRSDAGSPAFVRQPKDAYRGVKYRSHPNVAMQDAKIADVFRDTWFKESEIGDKFHDLALSIVSTDRSKDSIVTQVWDQFTKTGDRLALARALSDLANETRDQQLRHMAQATMGLALALDQGLMRKRFDARWSKQAGSPKYARAEALFMRQYWDEAVANYNISAQTYWNVGLRKTVIEGHYENSLSSQFSKQFGKEPKYYSLNIARHQAVRDKFHNLAQTNYSIGAVDVLRPTRRDEVISSGLAKVIHTNGKQVLAFEFSDADAYLDTSMSQGKAHLLPFVGMDDPEKAYSDYAFEVKRRAADPKSEKYIPSDMPIGKETTLGKVFAHDSMYYFYPEMRDVRVSWHDGYGAYAVPLANGEYMIGLGVRSFAASELNMKNHPDGMVFNDKSSMTSRFIGNNPLASIILHEAQHVLQYIGNMDDENGNFFYLNKEVSMGHFANLLGIKTNFALADVIGKNMRKDYIWSEADKTAAKDINAVADRIAMVADSPVYRNLQLNAKPLLKTATRNLAAFVASEADAGRMDDVIARRMLALDEGLQDVHTVNDVLNAYNELMAVREELRTKYPSYSTKMHFDVEYRAATSAIGLVRSVAAIEKATPSQRLVLIRQALEDFTDLDYILAPSERMARETEGRRMLTQDQINKTPRRYTEDFIPRGSILGMLQMAMDSSMVETTKGLMEKQTKALDAVEQGRLSPVSAIMHSIAGIGEQPDDNKGLTFLGKLRTVRYTLAKATEELSAINRFILTQRGWEVKDGKLTLQTGNFVVSGDWGEAMGKLRAKFSPDLREANYNPAEIGDVHTYTTGDTAGANGTYTISDIVNLAGLKIEAEDVLSLGNSVMDIVAGDGFPPAVKVSDIKALLAGDPRYTADSARMVMLDEVIQGLPSDKVLTKNDLLNVLAYNHVDPELMMNTSERNMGIGKAVPDVEKISSLPKERKMQVLRIFPDVVKSTINNLLRTDGNNTSEIYYGGKKMFDYGKFRIKGGEIEFNVPILEEFAKKAGVTDSDMFQFRERMKRGLMSKFAQRSVELNPTDASRKAKRLNASIVRLAVIIQPFLDEAINNLAEYVNNRAKAGKPNEARRLALAIMEDYQIAALGITTAEMNRGSNSMNLAGSYGFVGGFDSAIEMPPNMKRGLERITGEADSVGSYISEVGGIANVGIDGYSRSPFRAYPMASLHMLHGGFLMENPAVIPDFARFESGILATPAHVQEKTVTALSKSASDAHAGVGGINPYTNLASGNVEYFHHSLKDVYNNWSGHEFASMVTRSHEQGEVLRMAHDRYDGIIESAKHVLEMVNEGTEIYQAIENVTWWASDLKRYVRNRVNSETTPQMVIHELIATLEQRKEELRKSADEIMDVAKIQNNSMLAFKKLYGDSYGSREVMRRYDANSNTSLMIPYRFAETSHSYVAGTSVVQALGMAFADVDFSLANPDSPSSVIVPNVNPQAVIPETVSRNINTIANSAEIVVSGLIGATTYDENKTPVLLPSRQNPHMMGYLERLNPSALDGELMSMEAQSVIGGQMYASHNTFASYAELMGQETNLVTYATNNLGAQITQDYNNGIFSKNALLDGEPRMYSENKLNVGFLGLMVAPYILAHDSIGFADVSGTTLVQKKDLLKNTSYEALVAMAEKADLRVPEQAAEFRKALEDWMKEVDMQDSGYLDRVVYEASSNNAIDGTILRMNMLETHVLAERNPARADALHKANDLGATIGYDQHYGDSGVYGTDYGRRTHKDAVSYVNGALNRNARNLEMWQGIIFGIAALRGIETRAPQMHPYLGHGMTKNSGAIPEGLSYHTYGRPVSNARRLVDHGSDINSVGLEYDPSSHHVFAGSRSYGTRLAFKDQDPRYLSSTVSAIGSIVNPEKVSMHDAIVGYAEQVKDKLNYDKEGTVTGTKGAWFQITANSDVLKVDLGPSGPSGGRSKPIGVRRNVFGNNARRSMIVNRLANIAKQLGTKELSVQPARFSGSRKVSTAFLGITSSTKRAESFYTHDLNSLAFTGQGIVSLRQVERGRNSLGFSWTRLEDGRVMLNISPDVNMGSYLDACFSGNFVTPLGFSHRRSIGWDHATKTLIPQSPLSIIRKVMTNTKAMDGLDGLYASVIDFSSEPSRLQYERAAKVISERTLNGALNGFAAKEGKLVIRKSHDSVADAIRRIREGRQVMDFGQMNLNDQAHIGMFAAMGDMMMSSSPEQGYVTVVLPKNFTADDISRAFFTMVAHNHRRMGRVDTVSYQGNTILSRGTKDKAYDGGYHFDGYLTQSEMNHLSTYIRRYNDIQPVAGNVISSIPSAKGYARAEAATKTTDFSPTINKASEQYAMMIPTIAEDLGRLYERMSGSESGYHMPDVERSIAMNGDRSAVIQLLMPDQEHLQRYAWDGKNKNSVTIVRKSDKSGYMVGHDVVEGISESGVPIKKRKVVAFRTESEAKEYADKVSLGGIEAEIPNALFRNGATRIDAIDQKYGHKPTGGKADLIKVVEPSKEFLEAAPDENIDVMMYSANGEYTVGAIDAVFKSKAEAVAARDMLLKTEAITGAAPSVDRINLSVSGIGVYEHDVRKRLQFALGGSPIQFAPKVLTVLRTALVPMLERTSSGGQKKVKKAVDVATGNQWYEMFMENQVSKAEMRVTGLTEFLYGSKNDNITREEIAKFIWSMYPSTGRLSHEKSQSPYVTNVNSPTQAVRNSAFRYNAIREQHIKAIEEMIAAAPEDEKGHYVAMLAQVRKLHDDALASALEQFYEKPAVAELLDSRGSDAIRESSVVEFDRINKPANAEDVQRSYKKTDAISEPVLEVYRMMFNDAFARAKLEAASRLAGMELEIPDFRGEGMTLSQISHWSLDGNNQKTNFVGRGNSADVRAFGLAYNDTRADYTSYASGIGTYRWDTLFTDFEMNKSKDYIEGLKLQMKKEGLAPEEVERLGRMLNTAERIHSVKTAARASARNSGHKNTPNYTMQLGHARHSDVIVTAYHRPNAPIAEVGSSLSITDRPTIAALGIEELQSDPYQSATFGPKKEARLASTFEEVELTSVLGEVRKLENDIADKESAMQNLSSPYQYYSTSTKRKHRNAMYNLIAQDYWDNSNPLFRYMFAKQAMGDNSGMSDSYIRFNHDIKHPLSPEMKQKYGISLDYIPEVELGVDYDGEIHNTLSSRLMEYDGEKTGDLAMGVYSRLYGFDGSTYVGLSAVNPAILMSQLMGSSRQNSHGMLIMLATFGLQFNGEFMASLDRLNQHYSEGSNNRHGVNFDKIAMEIVMDYRRRVERSTIDFVDPDGRNFGGQQEAFMNWKRGALGNLKNLEMLYYKEGTHIVDHANKKQSSHVRKHEFDRLNTESPEYLRRKQAMVVTTHYLDTFTRHLSEYPNFKVTKEQAKERLRKVFEKSSKNGGQFYIELTVPEQVIFDIRMAATAAGMDVNAYIDAIDISKQVDTEGGYAVSSDVANAMRKIVRNPDKITHEDVRKLTDSGTFRILRHTDSDLDSTYDYPGIADRYAQPTEARTALGKLFEIYAPIITSVYASNKPDPMMDVMRTRLAELKQKLGPMAEGDFTYPDTIPLGEDNAYRPVMTNWYAMRALQSRKDALVVMDARHHRVRYSSTNNINYLFNLGSGIVGVLNKNAGGRKMMAYCYVMHEAKKQKTHGGFIDLLQSGQIQFESLHAEVEHNGKRQSIKNHLLDSAEEVIQQMPAVTSSSDPASLRNGIAAIIDSIEVNGTAINYDTNNRSLKSYITYAKTKGKDGVLAAIKSGVTDGEDTMKRIFTHFEKPQGIFMAVPVGRTHGYASNYGAPLWHNKLYYAGMQDALINQVSHDAFDVPDIKMVDGKYAIIDKKTQKVIAEGITNFSEAQERAAQASKYLGAVPIVSNFLKTFGKMGGYAMEGFMLATNKSESTHFKTLKNNLQPNYSAHGDVKNSMLAQQGSAGMRGSSQLANRVGSSFGDTQTAAPFEDSYTMNSEREQAVHGVFGPAVEEGAAENLDHMVAMHSMGVRVTSTPEEIAAAINRMAGFTGPMLVIRPKFPTANHVAEAKKAIINGIPFMSVAGVDSNQVKAKEAAEMFRFYIGAKNTRDYEPRPKSN